MGCGVVKPALNTGREDHDGQRQDQVDPEQPLEDSGMPGVATMARMTTVLAMDHEAMAPVLIVAR
jgi:hypothetical protein